MKKLLLVLALGLSLLAIGQARSSFAKETDNSGISVNF